MSPDHGEWPLRKYWIDIAWGAFAVLNLLAMLLFGAWETVPFHFIWVSVTLLYGFRVWKVRSTAWMLATVMLTTGTFILIDVSRGLQPIDEITEVPLMAAMFVAMVWHARRRLSAMEELERVSEDNLALLDRERRFIQDASHELRTPITVALGHAQLIQRNATDELVQEDAAVVADELHRLRRLAERLLVLAAAEHLDFLHTVPVELEELVTETLRRWSPTPRRWGLGEVSTATVAADPDRLQLAVDALVENAVKHTGPNDSIELSLTRNGRVAMLAVTDSGPGIDPEALDRIFDRFARADSSRSREKGGVGLGLSVVKTIVEAHGGSVQVRSSLGRGSRFVIRLPLASTDGRGSGPSTGATATKADHVPVG
jgi:signal transduction histidine kinase